MEAAVIMGLGLELIALIGAAIWVVGRIRSTTAVLSQAIEHLREAIQRLENQLQPVSDRTLAHENRLTRLEEWRRSIEG